eukprot:scaffold100739_cov17-Tisochrysis_lutea.AAC.2
MVLDQTEYVADHERALQKHRRVIDHDAQRLHLGRAQRAHLCSETCLAVCTGIPPHRSCSQ